MTSSNQLIDINNDKYLIRKSSNKLVLHHLPSLDIVHKYYSEINFFCVNKLEIILLYKNVLTFLKLKCPPLRLIQYQQDYLDWEPQGGLTLQNMVVLYDKATIAFYYRNPKLQKSWAIDVIQEIQQVKNSEDQNFIALKVKQPKNTIFVWDLNNMSKKPNQQIILKDKITKWEFWGKNSILVLTETQFKIYFVHTKSNQHYLHFYVTLSEKYTSFITLSQFNQTSIESGRKSVNTIAFLKQNSCDFDIIEFYDIEKRLRKFKQGKISNLQLQKLMGANKFVQPISGFQYEGKLMILAEIDSGIGLFQPKCFVLNQKLQVQKATQYKQHQGTHIQNIQYQNDYVIYLNKKQSKYILGKFCCHTDIKTAQFSSDKIKILEQFPSQQIQTAFLTKNNLIFINSNKKLGIQNLQKLQTSTRKVIFEYLIDFGKYNPLNTFYLLQNQDKIFFVNGIRYFKYDFVRKQLVNIGFVMKNQRAKLLEVRTQTSSLVYKINNQYVLLEYDLADQKGQKLTFRTIKSSENDKIMSLRKGRWLKMNLKQITLGQGQIDLATFNLQKMYKTLLQDNSYFEYELYWTTHGGIVMALKNYLFLLQVIQNQNGQQIHLIKKGHSYLHRRFSSSVKTLTNIKVVDSRSLVIYTGSRLIKLNNHIEAFVTQNPYNLPDTLLNRQLQMRQYYPPHHPSIINAMLQNGWFQEIIKIVQKLHKWTQQNKSINELYQIIKIQDYYKCPSDQLQITNQKIQAHEEYESVTIKTAPPRNQFEDTQNLNQFCQQIISHPQKLYLNQNNPLILQNLLRSIVFKIQNSRAFDYFSQGVITKTRILSYKNLPFKTIDVAFLMHSINKDQALQFLKGPDHKMQWAWIQKYSIVLWYEENIQKWKKWIQQIAMTLFRVQKDSFDCLFWYILANKKNLLVTLFKAQKFSSKQHDAMHTFLQRDFQDPKHRSAALKNAYALLDKKRYWHAMAFFLLADKKQECIRFAIDRLNDLNLAYLIHLISYGVSSTQTNHVAKNLIEKGDIWAQHIGWVQEKKHIASCNALLKEDKCLNWEFTPQLKGFHPTVLDFSQKIKQSIPYKRQLQMKNTPLIQQNQTINFNQMNFQSIDFQNQSLATSQANQNLDVQIKKQIKIPDFHIQNAEILDQFPEEQQRGLKRQLKQKAIKYYMRYHFPCLALTLKFNEQNKSIVSDVKRAYQLEKYMITGQVSQAVVEIAQGLDDIIALLKNDLKNQLHEQFHAHLTDFRERFEEAITKIKINQLNPPSKHQIGQLLHYSYFSETIFVQIQPMVKNIKPVQNQLMILSKTNNLGKIIVGICLKIYSEMGKNLQAFKNNMFIQANQQFWTTLRGKYDNLVQKKKEKHQKLMDSFQLSLNNHIKKIKDQEHLDFTLRMPKSSTAGILLWRKIFQFLVKCDDYLKQKVIQLKVRLDKVVNYWIEKQYINEIQSQISILINEGVQYRLKLNVLSNQFKERQLDTIEELLKLVYSSRQLKDIQDKKSNITQMSHQKQTFYNKQTNDQQIAVQVFKNRTQHLKAFSLNKNCQNGLEAVVLFKRAIRTFQVPDNLVNRDRTKDGYSLIHQDNAYISEIVAINQQQNLLKKTSIASIQNCIKNIYSSRRSLDQENIIKKQIRYQNSLKDYLNPLEVVSNIDFTQIYCIEAHNNLPIFFLGGKGLIEACRFDNLKNLSRILCTGMQEVIKIQSFGKRIYALDKQGNLSCFLFDQKHNNKPIFQLKKLGIIDFTCPSPSQIGCITINSILMYDTLLHPKHQCTFKLQISNPPIAITHLSTTELVVLRKHQVQIYDVKKHEQIENFILNGRGKCLHADVYQKQNTKGKIFIGRSDCKIKIIDLANKNQKIVRVGPPQGNYILKSDQKDKINIQSIKKFGNCYFSLRTDGSIYQFEG